KILAGLLCLSAYSIVPLFAREPVRVNEGERLFVGRNMEYFVDTTQKLSVTELLNKKFTPCQTEILNLGNIPHTVWMRFSVFSKTEKELYLEIDAPLLDQLEIFEMNGETPKLLFTGGSLKPF